MKVPLVTVPVCPLPDESDADVPELSSKAQKATGVGAVVLVTVSEIVVVWLRLPLVPVTVTVDVPVVAVLLAVSVNVLEPVEDAGLKDAVTPLGSPLAENETLPVKPPEGATVIVEVPLALRLTVRLDGLADRV